MKTIQSPFLGNTIITAKDRSVRLFQVRNVLNRHREILINSLLKDVPYFLAYRFGAKATPNELQTITEKLVLLKEGNVDLTKYQPIIEQMKAKSKTLITNEYFYKEIEELVLGTDYDRRMTA